MPDTRTLAVLALIIGVAALAGVLWHASILTPPAHSERE